MKGCIIDDCNGKLRAYTMCNKHYLRWRRYGVASEFNRSHEQHGMSFSPEYRAWKHIFDRCYRPKDKAYKNYGARGITICEQWKVSFIAFYKELGPRPSPRHSLDRIDNKGNYEPGNCRWATSSEQNYNRRKRIGNTGGFGAGEAGRELARRAGAKGGRANKRDNRHARPAA